MKIYTIPLGSLQTNCYVIASQIGNAAIVDPGADPQHLIKGLMALGAKPVMILLTHAHYDHIGAIKGLREHFGELPLAIGEGDTDMLTDIEISLGGRFGNKKSDYEGITWQTQLKDGDCITLDELQIKVVATPGHTKGGVCYVVGNSIFSGDTLFKREVGRCDLYGGSFEAIKESIAKLYALPGDYEVYPGHGESTLLSEEKTENPYVRG